MPPRNDEGPGSGIPGPCIVIGRSILWDRDPAESVAPIAARWFRFAGFSLGCEFCFVCECLIAFMDCDHEDLEARAWYVLVEVDAAARS